MFDSTEEIRMFQFNGFWFIVIAIVVCIILNYAVVRPLKKRAEDRRRVERFFRECPQELLHGLSENFMQDDGKFVTPSQEDQAALMQMFGPSAVAAAVELLSTGKTTVIVRHDEPWSVKSQDLSVVCKNGLVVPVDLSPPRIICTTYGK